VVPIEVMIDGETHHETDLDIDVFYERLLGGATVSTSLPSPGRFAEAYHAAASVGAAEVVSVHLDARVSGTVGAAQLAAADAEIPVTVVDAGTASFGVGVCVLAAARAARGGCTGAEIEALIARLAPSVDNAFVAAASAGGRIGSTPGLTLLTFADGATTAVGSCDSLEHAADAIAARVPAARSLRAAVGHAHRSTAHAADRLAAALEAKANVRDVLRYRVSPSVGAHTGPTSFGAFWWPNAATAWPH
jgi:DegV family protein with EDD domain